jgi:hypothetical protein
MKSINLGGQEGRKQKVHSLVDKVYSRKNLKLAWERVRANQGASGAGIRR